MLSSIVTESSWFNSVISQELFRSMVLINLEGQLRMTQFRPLSTECLPRASTEKKGFRLRAAPATTQQRRNNRKSMGYEIWSRDSTLPDNSIVAWVKEEIAPPLRLTIPMHWRWKIELFGANGRKKISSVCATCLLTHIASISRFIVCCCWWWLNLNDTDLNGIFYVPSTCLINWIWRDWTTYNVCAELRSSGSCELAVRNDWKVGSMSSSSPKKKVSWINNDGRRW